MLGLTAKVFRTYNASWTFVQQLKDTPEDASVADKILAYNRANRLVAVLCNHQRSVSKGHGVVMEKMADKVRTLGSHEGSRLTTSTTTDPSSQVPAPQTPLRPPRSRARQEEEGVQGVHRGRVGRRRRLDRSARSEPGRPRAREDPQEV